MTQKNERLCSLLLCLVTYCNTVTAIHPGLTLRISENGLKYAASVAIDQLVTAIQGRSLPGQSGSSDIAVGKVDYAISSLKITYFVRPTSSINVVPGRGVTWSLSNVGAAINGEWSYDLRTFFKISDHGNFDVTISDTSLTVIIAMGVDANGHPTINMESCKCDVGNVYFAFHGAASWLYNLFDDVIEKPISDSLQGQLCDSVRKSINTDAGRVLSRMKVHVPVEKIFTLDYRLVAKPVFGENFIESHHKGEFMWTRNQTEAPFLAQPMTAFVSAQEMVTICLSDYVTHTLGYVIYKYGPSIYHSYTLTKDDLHLKEKHYLNTKNIIALEKKYPNSSLEVSMRMTAPPSLRTTHDVIVGRLQSEIDINVRMTDGRLYKGFNSKVEARIVLSGTLSEKMKVTAKVNHITFRSNIINSAIGKTDNELLKKQLQFVLDAAAQGFLKTHLNAVGQKGFDIPAIDRIHLIQPQLHLYEGSLCFSSDVRYDSSF